MVTGKRPVVAWIISCGVIVSAAGFALADGPVVPASGATTRPAGDQAPGGTPPTITITGKRSPVEQGEKSIFTALPPRDVMKRPLTESPGLDTATSIVGKEEILWLDAFSVVDATKYVPGGWTETRGRKVKQFFSVRGQRYPYPAYLIDGAWFREFHETNYFLSAANVERIEILRSSSSLLLSPGGMTGVINVIPRTYTRQETQLDFVYGADNTARTQLSHGNAVGNLSYALGVGYRHTDGPDHMNASENISNIYGRVAYKPIPEWAFSLSAMSFFGDRHLKLAEPPASNTFRTRTEHFDPMHTYVVVGKARYEPSERAATEVTGNYALRRFHGYRKGQWSDRLEKDYEYGARVIQTLKLCDANTLRVGGLYNHWVSPTGKRFYVGRRGDLETYSGVIVDEHDFGRLLVDVGYRITRTYINDFGGFNVEGGAKGLTSVRVQNEWEDPLHTLMLGASYALTDVYSLHANFALGQIASAPGMLNADLQRPGMETRQKYDFGIKGRWDGFGEASLTAFYVHQQDAALLTSAKVTVNGEDYGLYENADRDNYGIELDARSKRFDCGLQFFLNAVAMQTRRESNGDWERDKEVPEFIIGGGVSYLVGDFEIAVLAKHISSYENDRFLPAGSDPAPVGDFVEVNAKVTYCFGKEKKHSVFFGVENLCNKRYSTVVGYPDEGIRFKGGMRLRF